MKTTALSQALFAVGGLWLIITGATELSTQSRGATSWAEETSFMALGQRSQGSLKIGLGLGLMGASSLSNASNNGAEKESTNEKSTNEGRESTDEGSNSNIGIADQLAHDECLTIFVKNGKYGTPVYSKFQNQDHTTYILLDKDGKELAVFKKKDSGNWSMPFWLN